ncbi:MAG: hypothetical protein ACYCU5_05585 [Actinomycetes bacterium]
MALAVGPAVVIVELSELLQQIDLSALAPQAVLIDASMAVTRSSTVSPGAAGLERILQAVRGSAVPRPAQARSWRQGS